MVQGKTQASKRKLAAIMFTDIVGYTALTQTDESLALEILEKHNRLLRSFFPKFNGREVKSIGDSFLIEFDSALDATLCAIEIQRALHDYNVSTWRDWKIKIRIGVHLGDVIRKGRDILGDAVNIASRIQPLASPEGICISQQVFDQTHNKISYPLEPIREAQLKNVAFTTPVYTVRMPWEDAKSQPSELAIGNSAKRRIAVLPFSNMSRDPDDEFFVDGLTEEIITVLSQIRGLRVIARTSTNHYKKTDKSVSQIAQELGVGTILEGSVRKSGNKIRATLQLIDAKSQEHDWSQNYDRNLDDIFEIQTDIARNVAEALRVKILAGEEKRIEKKETNNSEAYLAYLKGRSILHSRDEANLREAKKQFEYAISLDQKFARAYSGLADTLLILGDLYIPHNQSLEEARPILDKALEIDPNLAEAHTTSGVMHGVENQLSAARDEFRRAIELNQSYAPAYHWYGTLLMFGFQKLQEAYQQLCLAEQADPLSARILSTLYVCLTYMGRIEEAKTKLDKLGAVEPEGMLSLDSLFDYYLFRRPDLRKVQGLIDKLEKLLGDELILAYYAEYYAVTGQKEGLKQTASELESLSSDRGWRILALITCYTALGDIDRCFQLLDALPKDPILSGQIILKVKFNAFARRMASDQRWQEFLSRHGVES